MEKILVVTSRDDLYLHVHQFLNLRYKVEQARSEDDLKSKVELETYEMFLVDYQLPTPGSLNVCLTLRNREKTHTTPLILISENSTPQDRALAFSVGINDFLTYPLDGVEFVARIAAKIQYCRSLTRTKRRLTKGPFHVDLEAQRIHLRPEGESKDLDLNLTPIEFKTFIFLINHEGKTLSRDEIKTAIWGSSVHVDSRSIDKHISSQRRKMAPFEDCILTAPGFGYGFSLSQFQTQNQAEPA